MKKELSQVQYQKIFDKVTERFGRGTDDYYDVLRIVDASIALGIELMHKGDSTNGIESIDRALNFINTKENVQ